MPESHSDPIMQGFSHPRERKELRVVVVVVLVIAASAIGIRFALARMSAGRTIEAFREATVERRNLDRTLELSGSIETLVRRTLSAEYDGTAVSVPAESGMAVEKGEVLAVLESEELEKLIRENDEKLLDARRQLEKKETERSYRVKLDGIAREESADAVEAAKADLDRQQKLFAMQAVPKKDVEAVGRELERLTRELERQDLERESAGRMYELETQELRSLIGRYSEEASRLAEDERNLTIRAPFPGTVVSVNTAAEADVRKDDAVVSIADTGTIEAVFQVSETNVGSLRAGMPVTVGYGDGEYPGIITSIGSEASSSADGPARVEVRARFEETPEGVIIGTTISGTVLIGRKENALVLPRDSYLASGAGRYVYVIRNGFAVKTPCTFGAVEGTRIEVLSGLEEGDRVIISEYEAFPDAERVRITENTTGGSDDD